MMNKNLDQLTQIWKILTLREESAIGNVFANLTNSGTAPCIKNAARKQLFDPGKWCFVCESLVVRGRIV